MEQSNKVTQQSMSNGSDAGDLAKKRKDNAKNKNIKYWYININPLLIPLSYSW